MSASQVELNLASHQASSPCLVGWAGREACLGSLGSPCSPKRQSRFQRMAWRDGERVSWSCSWCSSKGFSFLLLFEMTAAISGPHVCFHGTWV